MRAHPRLLARTPARALALALTLAAPLPAWAEAADLPALELAWHGCVRAAYDRQPDQSGRRAGRERTALDACKAHEDAYVAALMAARPDDGDRLLIGWAKTWSAYVAYVVDPVAAWIGALTR